MLLNIKLVKGKFRKLARAGNKQTGCAWQHYLQLPSACFQKLKVSKENKLLFANQEYCLSTRPFTFFQGPSRPELYAALTAAEVQAICVLPLLYI
jgi:hypothetical protein